VTCAHTCGCKAHCLKLWKQQTFLDWHARASPRDAWDVCLTSACSHVPLKSVHDQIFMTGMPLGHKTRQGSDRQAVELWCSCQADTAPVWGCCVTHSKKGTDQWHALHDVAYPPASCHSVSRQTCPAAVSVYDAIRPSPQRGVDEAAPLTSLYLSFLQHAAVPCTAPTIKPRFLPRLRVGHTLRQHGVARRGSAHNQQKL
jgi:hypothetical protein